MSVSEYELERQRNIEANNAELVRLGLMPACPRPKQKREALKPRSKNIVLQVTRPTRATKAPCRLGMSSELRVPLVPTARPETRKDTCSIEYDELCLEFPLPLGAPNEVTSRRYMDGCMRYKIRDSNRRSCLFRDEMTARWVSYAIRHSRTFSGEPEIEFCRTFLEPLLDPRSVLHLEATLHYLQILSDPLP